MLDKNYMEMIYRKIDGEITQEEEQILEELFKKSPEAVNEYESMVKLSEYYRKNEVVPPQELKSHVMDEVRGIQAKRAQKIVSVPTRKKVSERIFNIQSLFPFAVGAAAAAIFMAFVIKSPSVHNMYDPSDLSGTIVSKNSSQPAEKILSKPLALISGENNITVSYTNDLVVVRVVFDTDNDAYFDFSINTDKAGFVAYERSSDANGIVNIENGNFVIAQPGQGVYSFYFKILKDSSFSVNYHISVEDKDISDNLDIAL